MPPPPRPLTRSKVFLVFDGDDSVEQALERPEAIAALDEALWLAVKNGLQQTGPFGSVAGVHLDLPFRARSAEGYGAVVAALRARMPPTMPLSVSLRFSPAPEDREKMKTLLSACDGLVAFVFGEGNAADPVAVDALEKRWWAGYAPSARGVWKDARGDTQGSLPEWVLERLSDDPQVEFIEDVSLGDESDEGFELKIRTPVSLGPFSFSAGDDLTFRQPLTSELIYRLESDLAGRRFARGRVIAVPGRSETERALTLAALNDILLGRPAKPELHVTTEAGREYVAISAENVSPHGTVISRTSNWVEVRLPSRMIRDVQIGGFDRFEVYGRDRQPVALGLATVVRFYETVIQPYEKIRAARILLRGTAPRDCCETRFHFLAASGQEVVSQP